MMMMDENEFGSVFLSNETAKIKEQHVTKTNTSINKTGRNKYVLAEEILQNTTSTWNQ